MEKRVTRGSSKKDTNNNNTKNTKKEPKKKDEANKPAMKRAGTMASTAEEGESFLKDQGYKHGKGKNCISKYADYPICRL